MNNKTKQIIVVVSVFILALASLGTVIGLLVSAGRLSEYSNGFSYTLSGTRATITGYDGDDTDVVVPDKVRGNRVVSVAKDAFKSKASEIKTITFKSNSSFTLEDEAFQNLTALEKVVLPSSLKEIPDGAFSGCKALKSVIIPDSVTRIGDDAFKNCSALVFAYKSEDYSTEGENAIDEEIFYMPSGLLEIGSSAFESCTSLIGAHFNKVLEKVGEDAFSKASALTELTLDEDCELASIGNGAFQNTKLSSTSNNLLIFPHLTSIGDRAFANVTTNFSRFKIPATVKSIGANAFMGCTSLSYVFFDEDVELESMGEGVFLDCTVLENVGLVGKENNTITQYQLPDSLKEIPAKTFMGCSRLLYSYNFNIGKNVETIGEGAFAIYTNSTAYATRDRALVVDEENENFAIVNLQKFSKTSTTSSYSHGLLTNADYTEVYAYFGSYDNNSYFGDKISNNELEENARAGETFGFYDTDGIWATSITTIKAYAFAGVAFKDIRLPKTVENIGEYVFLESEILEMSTEAIGWNWEKTSFSKKDDGDPEVSVSILWTGNGSYDEKQDFAYLLSEDNIYAYVGSPN